jgi:predicted dehydrogenase
MKTYRIAVIGPPQNDASHSLPLSQHPRFELLEPDAADLDAIVVASEPAAHTADTLAALERGLHVLVALPFAVDFVAALQMSGAAKASGRVCGVAYKYRFTPQALATKELIENAHLGPMRSIEITAQHGDRRLAERQERGWWFERGLGGGVAELGLSNSIDLAIWFAGRPPKKMTGFVRTANPHRQDKAGSFGATADDGAFALLDFGAGLIARLSHDATAPVESYVCAVYGEDRVAVSSGRQVDETTLYTVDDDETNELQCKPSAYEKSLGIDTALSMELYDEFIKQIETGESALPTAEDAHMVQAVLVPIGAFPMTDPTSRSIS